MTRTLCGSISICDEVVVPSFELRRKDMSQNDITALFDQWNAAIQTGDPKTVAALYESNGILLPTLSNKVRHNHEEIEDYFARFLEWSGREN